jgi:hypothetical protein
MEQRWDTGLRPVLPVVALASVGFGLIWLGRWLWPGV